MGSESTQVVKQPQLGVAGAGKLLHLCLVAVERQRQASGGEAILERQGRRSRDVLAEEGGSILSTDLGDVGHDVVEQAVRTLELSVLAKYAFGLAQAFNAFYHRYSIINEERADTRIWRAAAVSYYRSQLTLALELMGCTVPTRM